MDKALSCPFRFLPVEDVVVGPRKIPWNGHIGRKRSDGSTGEPSDRKPSRLKRLEAKKIFTCGFACYRHLSAKEEESDHLDRPNSIGLNEKEHLATQPRRY